jgi:hypothetical protein
MTESKPWGAAKERPKGAAGNLCDVAPSRFERFDRDEYFTIDAGWIVPALCRAVQVEGPILEPCAGRGHMVRELRAQGFVVRGADLYAYADTLVPDIKSGADVFDLKSLAGYRFVVSNLPYREQAAILAYLQSRPAMECAWRFWRAPSGARPRPAAPSFTRMRNSLEKCGLRSALSGFARRSRRRAIGSAGSFGRRSRARLAKTPFCASLAKRLGPDPQLPPNGRRARAERGRSISFAGGHLSRCRLRPNSASISVQPRSAAA